MRGMNRPAFLYKLHKIRTSFSSIKENIWNRT